MAPKTSTERSRERRKREKEWLKKHGFTSWESLHTKLMKGEIRIKQTSLKEVRGLAA